MKKRIVGLFLAVCMTLTLSVPVHAETEYTEEVPLSEEDVIEEVSSPETEQSLAIPDGITVSTLFESDISTTKVKSLD